MFQLIKDTVRRHLSIRPLESDNIDLYRPIPKISAPFVDLILILDSSKSMQDNDPENIRKQAASNLVSSLYDHDRIGIMEFGNNAHFLTGLTNIKNKALEAIQQSKSREEGTYINKAISAALAEFTKKAASNHRAIILFTDGAGRYDEKLNLQARHAGIKIFTVGLGSNINTYLLQSIALKPGGKYLHASLAHELLEIFQRLQKTIRIMAENEGRLLLN